MALLPYTPPRGSQPDPVAIQRSEDSKYMMGLLMQMLLANQQNQISRESLNVQKEIAAGNIKGALEQVREANKGALEAQQVANQGRIAEQEAVGAQNRQTQAAAHEQAKEYLRAQAAELRTTAEAANRQRMMEKWQGAIEREIAMTGREPQAIIDEMGDNLWGAVASQVAGDQAASETIMGGLLQKRTNGEYREFLEQKLKQQQQIGEQIKAATQMYGSMGIATSGGLTDFSGLTSSDPNAIAQTLLGSGVKLNMEVDMPILTKAISMANGNGQVNFTHLAGDIKKVGTAGGAQYAAYLESLADGIEAKYQDPEALVREARGETGTKPTGAPMTETALGEAVNAAGKAIKGVAGQLASPITDAVGLARAPSSGALATASGKIEEARSTASKLREAAANLRHAMGGDPVLVNQQQVQRYTAALNPKDGMPFDMDEVTKAVWQYPDTAEQAKTYYQKHVAGTPFAQNLPEEAFLQRVLPMTGDLQAAATADAANTRRGLLQQAAGEMITDMGNAKLAFHERGRLARLDGMFSMLTGVQAGNGGEVPQPFLDKAKASLSGYNTTYPEFAPIAAKLQDITAKAAESSSKKYQDAQKSLFDLSAQQVTKDRNTTMNAAAIADPKGTAKAQMQGQQQAEGAPGPAAQPGTSPMLAPQRPQVGPFDGRLGRPPGQ